MELLKLLPVEQNHPADLNIIQQKVSEITRNIRIDRPHYKLSAGEFWFRYKNNTFHYSHAKRVLSVDVLQHDTDFWQALYGPVFSTIVYFFNCIPLHASGVVLSNKTILISGTSGSGKSSIAWLLMQKMNARFFADDITVLNKNENTVQAHSSYPEIKLWDDIVSLYQLDKQHQIHPEIEKYFIQAKEYFTKGSFIPNVVVFVQTTPDHKPQIEQISGTKKFSLLYKHLYRKHLTQKVFSANDFEILALLANQASVYLLNRPQLVVDKEWSSFIVDTFTKL